MKMGTRKRITEQALGNWDEANEALKKIGEAQTAIAVIEADLNTAIAEAKEKAKAQAKEYEEVVRVQEAMLSQWTAGHKQDLKGKSRKLTHGTVGFRASTKLVLPRDTHTIIQNLKGRGMMDCLNTKVTVNKDVLRTYEEQEIVAVGAALKTEDAFWYEVDQETLGDE